MWLQSRLSKLMQREKAIQLEGSCLLPSCCLGDSSWAFSSGLRAVQVHSHIWGLVSTIQLQDCSSYFKQILYPRARDSCLSEQPLSGAVSLPVSPSWGFPSALWSVTTWANIWLIIKEWISANQSSSTGFRNYFYHQIATVLINTYRVLTSWLALF